jgi:rRNA processing protein Krr1/Pno1
MITKSSYKIAADKAEATNDDGRHVRGTISENGEITIRMDSESAEMILDDIRYTHGKDFGQKLESFGPVRWVLVKLLEGNK